MVKENFPKASNAIALVDARSLRVIVPDIALLYARSFKNFVTVRTQTF